MTDGRVKGFGMSDSGLRGPVVVGSDHWGAHRSFDGEYTLCRCLLGEYLQIGRVSCYQDIGLRKYNRSVGRNRFKFNFTKKSYSFSDLFPNT